MGLFEDIRLLRDLKDRRFAQFFIVYAVAAWGVLQVVDQLADRQIVPELVYRVALTLAACGLPGVGIVTWFHGAKGNQEVVPLERWLLAGVAVFAVGASGLVIRAEVAPDEVAQAPAQLEAWEDPARVAVLYFDPRGSDEDAPFISAGLTEGLIDDLSGVEALHVVSRNGSELFRGAPASPDSIGRTLGVGSLVNGRVTIADDRVRVDIALVEASSGRQLASTRLEQARTDVFALQDQLTEEVSAFLRERLGGELALLEERRETNSLEAWELARQAEDWATEAEALSEGGDTDAAAATLLGADSLLALVEDLDPRWIRPVTRRGWLAYAQARLRGTTDRGPQDDLTQRGLSHAERALAMDPADADALELRGTLRYWRFLLNLSESPEALEELFALAEEDLQASVAENPEQASAWSSLSHLLIRKGDIPRAKLAAVRAYEADPFLRDVNLTLWRLASTSWQLADEVEAERWCGVGARRFPDDFRFAQCRLMVLSLTDDADLSSAWEHLDDFVRLSPPDQRELNEGMGHMMVALALARQGEADSARTVAAAGRVGPDVDPLRQVALMEAAVRTWVEDFAEATDLLSLSLSSQPGALESLRSAAESGELPWELRPLADQPEFRELVGLR